MTMRFGMLMALLALLVACKGEEPTKTPAAARAENAAAARPAASSQDVVTPVYGGRIVQATIGEPSNLIPNLATDSSSASVTGLLYISLLRYDKNLNLVPYAAQSYEVLDGGKRIRFHLRRDIVWQDGAPLTARDVEFTYKMMIDPKTPTAYGDDYKAVSEFRLIDDYTFEVLYDKVFARSLITWAGEIVPRHILEHENLLETKYAREPVGAGPYMLKEWVPGRYLVLTANPRYFLGRPYVDRIILRIIPDTGTQFMELKAHNLDMMDLTPKQYLFQTEGPEWRKDFTKYKYVSFGYTYLGYNLKNPLFTDRRVRQALAHAIDKQEIIKIVLFGLGMPAVGPYKPGTWVYDDKIASFSYDPEKARAMLAEAGWRDTDGDGILDKDGRPFAFTILTNQGNEQRSKTAIIIQERLRQIGIKVEIRTIEWASFIKEFINPGNFDAVILGWSTTVDPDNYTVWHSSQTPPQGLNFVHYANPEVDRLLEEGRETLDQAVRKRIYDRIQELLHDDQPYCFLYVPYALPIVSARIRGIEPAPAGITYNFERWWIEPSRSQPALTQ
ncbi:ABC-type transporter, periplasmic subunit [Desulfovibrio sp. X2]|uniref:peptide-binding protein n=1 Tax=Desulfovibrio sp. X2 TaxID=941449 RepID=UPI000358E59F|nr:peptide-binding protein [Desulfovibrio sp. X2]EPR37328.1 ABC-type transporter, periplasmic subunit [Desulfovibrio sp. X2]